MTNVPYQPRIVCVLSLIPLGKVADA